jgi:hypothetical protein
MLHFSVLVWMYKQEETDTWHNYWVLVGWCLMTYICQLSSQWNSGRTSSPSFRYLYTATIRSFFLKLFMLPVMFNPIYRWSVSSRCLADLKLDKNNQRSISQKKKSEKQSPLLNSEQASVSCYCSAVALTAWCCSLASASCSPQASYHW